MLGGEGGREERHEKSLALTLGRKRVLLGNTGWEKERNKKKENIVTKTTDMCQVCATKRRPESLSAVEGAETAPDGKGREAKA